MKIFSRFDRPKIPPIECPTMLNVYSYDSISKELVKVGEKNLQAFINAPAPDCSIYSKINRFVNGDLFALGNGNVKGVYTDVSGMPTDINTIHNLVKDVNRKIKAVGASEIPSFLDMLHNAASRDRDSSVIESAQNKNESEVTPDA